MIPELSERCIQTVAKSQSCPGPWFGVSQPWLEWLPDGTEISQFAKTNNPSPVVFPGSNRYCQAPPRFTSMYCGRTRDNSTERASSASYQWFLIFGNGLYIWRTVLVRDNESVVLREGFLATFNPSSINCSSHWSCPPPKSISETGKG